MKYLLPSEVELQAVIAGEDIVKVVFCDGDGCVPVLDRYDGKEVNYSVFRQFLADCLKNGTYPLLCVEAALKAWIDESNDALDEMRLEYSIQGQKLYVREKL